MAQEKADDAASVSSSSSTKGPSGGTDRTVLPANVPPGWTIKFTFHGARNLPPADLRPFSSDPFLFATLKKTNLPVRHAEDPRPTFRTPTQHATTDPDWEVSWIIANCPSGGFEIKCRLYDEDPSNHDDRLGNAYLPFDGPVDERLHWDHKSIDIKRRKGSWRAYGAQHVTHALSSVKGDRHGHIIVSVEVLGRTQAKSGAKAYTIGPNYSFQHYSPLIGRIAKTKGTCPADGGAERYDFEANQMQLKGPVPDELYQRYVAFKPWVTSMFSSTGLKGKTLHYVLRKQHNRIYNFGRRTHYICCAKPGPELALQLLRMAHFDEGGRVFTYVVLLDGMFRFTETGKEFGIDLLSKHTMHSCVSTYIAFSGEFYIRRAKSHEAQQEPLEKQGNDTHPPTDLDQGPPDGDAPEDPALYELIIDNDSGTYRPAADLLPAFEAFMQSNFSPLRVIAMNCADDETQRLKEEQHKIKESEGDKRVFVQPDMSDSDSDNESAMSSAEESLDERIENLQMDGEGKSSMSKGLRMKRALLKPKAAIEKVIHPH